MNNVTLWSVNWNQQKALELMLRSYIMHNYNHEPLNVMIVDNGSTDGSREWLEENGIPFLSLQRNVGHERALQFSYNMINTPLAMLCDSDIKFKFSIEPYIQLLNEFDSVGEVIEGEEYDGHPLMPRVAPWFHLFKIQKMKDLGVCCWRGTDAWQYDVGSWYYDKMKELGLKNYRISKPFYEQVGGDYGRYFHFSQVSTDSSIHGVSSEVSARRNHIFDEVRDMPKTADFRAMLSGINEQWGNDKIDKEIEKGWVCP